MDLKIILLKSFKGPIPFIYAAEVFRQEARGAALAACMTMNWVANLILSLSFEYLAMILTNYVFLVFTVVVGFSVIVIFRKVTTSYYHFNCNSF